MQDITENIANVRYLMNEAVNQTNKVHDALVASNIDLESVQLNMKDLSEQLLVVQAELLTACIAIQQELCDDGEQDTTTI